MVISNVTIGSDPELFIFNTKTNKVKSAVNLIPGTKEEPKKIEELGDGYAIQTDNILAEFNIPPTSSKGKFIDSIEKMKSYIRDFVKEVNPNLDILCCASQKVPLSELKSKQAREFGCSVDYCIYTNAANPKPKGTRTSLRSAGFHLHVGYDKPNINKSLTILHYVDAYVGLPSILIDTDTERRNLYGKAGCFRLTKYGFEYRTLSSFWISSPERIEWVWTQLLKALHAAQKEFILPDKLIVEHCINTSDTKTALKLCNEYGLCAEFLE